MGMFKKIFSIFLLLNFFINMSFAANIETYKVDDSVDSKIRAKYNTKKIEEDLLPALPPDYPTYDDYEDDAFTPSSTPSQVKNENGPSQPQTQTKTQTQTKSSTSAPTSAQTKPPAQTQSQSTPKTQPIVNQTPKQAQVSSSSNNSVSAVLKKGKKFKATLRGTISDKTAEGTPITFVTQYPEPFTYVTIPAGTVFKGKVVESHPPYIAGNGGLVVIGVYQMMYKGKAYDVDTKISVANGKKVFFNNIKGKRKFMQNMWNSTKPGNTFFKKMWRTTCKLARNENGADIVVAPFSFLIGTLVYAVNIAASPLLALFTKGGSLTIPSGATFVIQLTKDTVLY